jgi:hypothetical protein
MTKKYIPLLVSTLLVLQLNASPSSKSIQNVVLVVPTEHYATELITNAQEKHLATVSTPAWFDRAQLASFQVDQIRHALEQKNALQDKPTSKSYYLVLDFKDLEILEEKNEVGWKSTVNGHLYKIDRSSFNRRINSTEYPLFYVGSATIPIRVTRPIGHAGLSNQLLKELMQKGIDENLDSLQTLLEHYVEQAPILGKRPLRARIGTMENIRLDDRFMVYDYGYDVKAFQTKKVFRGIVRATRTIVDNSLDSTGSTIFYQTFGLSLKPGDILEKKMNSGWECSIANSTGGVGGWTARLDARLSRHVGIQSMYLYLEGGIEKAVQTSSIFWGGRYNLYRMDGGIAKGFQLFPNLELRPYVGIGLESNTYGFKYQGIRSEYMQFGTNAYLQIGKSIKVFGGYSRHKYLSFWKLFDEYYIARPWLSYFPDRSDGTFTLGITVEL